MARRQLAVLAAALLVAPPALAEPPAPAAPAAPTEPTTTLPPANAPSAGAPVAGATTSPPESAPTAVPAPIAVAPTPVAPLVASAPTDAIVHVAVNYGSAALEARSRVDVEDWRTLCPAPCDHTLRVEGTEVRVTAPGMTPSNVFVIDPGPGVARLRVSGGSSTARSLGIVGLGAGLPVAFVGMTLFGIGSIEDASGARAAGIATLAVGAVVAVAALPLLLVGSTSVKNEKGQLIARGAAAPAARSAPPLF